MLRKTAVLKDPLFLEHDPGYDHVESPERLSAIYQALARPEEAETFFYPECEPASYADLAANHTAEHIERVAETAGKQFDVLDPDTHTSPRSYEAAVLAAGAVITGLKLVAAGKADNAAALVRPPGHHAEADRAKGFCLFNNIAIGARYGLKHLGMERIFILDWDLHHGNGTQNAFYDTDQVFYCSTHQYPHYPGTGALKETGAGKGEGYTLNVPLPGGQGDQDFARIMTELVAPVARQYRPDCIMVSAGYDTHVSDPLGGMGVTTAGFAGMTRILVDLATELCEGRLVLVLEGGYFLQGLADGVLASLHEMAGKGGLPTEAFTAMAQSKKPLPALDAALDAAKKHWTF
ncbi:MAG: histone deacetylase [Deltaproteobacteria bacterium]|uniref:histone deacetylase family protein n=1 Tax=Hydrosulfovibrio ferrireducens TaxID=2934181 RepID=UPI0011FEDD2F|nr:MAG: histone deacetylase [Deltaproteobacteria bacterium]